MISRAPTCRTNSSKKMLSKACAVPNQTLQRAWPQGAPACAFALAPAATWIAQPRCARLSPPLVAPTMQAPSARPSSHTAAGTRRPVSQDGGLLDIRESNGGRSILLTTECSNAHHGDGHEQRNVCAPPQRPSALPAHDLPKRVYSRVVDRAVRACHAQRRYACTAAAVATCWCAPSDCKLSAPTQPAVSALRNIRTYLISQSACTQRRL